MKVTDSSPRVKRFTGRSRSLEGILCLFLFLLLFCTVPKVAVAQQSAAAGREDEEQLLPIWLTRRENDRIATLKGHTPDNLSTNRDSPRRSSFSGTSPISLPAEFEPSKAILLSWSYFSLYTSLMIPVAEAIAAEGIELWVIGGITSLPNVPDDLFMSIDLPFDSPWVRDFGPFGIYQTGQVSTGLEIVDTVYYAAPVRPNDDSIPCLIANEANVTCNSHNLILDGGNVMTDGYGNLFMTTVTYVWNNDMTTYEVDSALRGIFGVNRIHAIDYARDQNGFPADGTGHIDMFVKLLNPTTLLVSQTTDPVFQTATDAAADYFASLRCGRRRCYQVLRVPGWSTDASFGHIWYSYTNSLIVGNSILVPGYSSGNDDAVKAIYEQAAPGKNVTMINSDGIIEYGGSIHCLTMQIPVDPSSDAPSEDRPSQSPSFVPSDFPSLSPSFH